MKSLHGSKKDITEAQYLAEFICQKCAKVQKVYLPPIFWKVPDYEYWTKKFVIEVIKANKLLKDYSLRAILLALQDGRCVKVQSLLNKYLRSVTAEKQRELDNIEELAKTQKEIEVNMNIISIPPKLTNKKNKLTKLRD